MTLQEALNKIKPLNKEIMENATAYQDSLIKPLGSLGKLEDIAVQLSGITGLLKPVIKKKCIIVYCADNGVWAEGVSACPQNITLSQAINFTNGNSGINVLSRLAGADLRIVDIGIAADTHCPAILNRKISYGTKNMAVEAAMTNAEAIQALEVGINCVEALKEEGYQLLGTGEMGIANTSTSSAVLMALTGLSADLVIGRGAGLTMEGFEKKKRTIEQALTVNKPNPTDAIDVLSKVGGFDIAGMAGSFIGAAALRLPIVIDGFISAVAALVAVRIHPGVRSYLIPSHASAEPGYQYAMDALRLSPALLMNMRLGEGTGCALMFQIIDAAVAVMAEMDTFEKGHLVNDFMVDIR